MIALFVSIGFGLCVAAWRGSRLSLRLLYESRGNYSRAMIYTQCAHLIQMDRLEIALSAGAYPRRALQ